MSTPPSRYLVDLDAKIAGAGDPISADCLRAQRAGHLARQGHTDEARALIASLRERYAKQPNVAVSGWVALAEGMLGYFADMGLGARDKFLRAQALSASASLDSLDALSSAWLGQMEYSSLRVDGLVAAVRRALRLGGRGERAALCRVSLVVAQALHLARRLDVALPWYERAHALAVAEGDDATISAFIHNMAWLRLFNLRQSVLQGEGITGDARFAIVGQESMGAFDAAIGAVSFKELDPLLRAQAYSLQDQPQEAVAVYEQHLGDVKMIGARRLQSSFLADRSWCKARVGDLVGATVDASAAEMALHAETQLDDRAATHSWLALTLARVGNQPDAQAHVDRAGESWTQLREVQSTLLKLLADLSPPE